MPLIQCHLAGQLSPADSKRLIADLVEATVQALGADPKTITVIVQEHDAARLRQLEFAPAIDPSRRPGEGS